MKKLKCYIGGALNADAVGYIKNSHQMCKWAEKVRKLGISVYVPSIEYMLGFFNGDWDYNDYFDNSQPWLEVSDCMFLVPGYKDSEGVKKEMVTAHLLGIPIFDHLGLVRGFIESRINLDKSTVYNQRGGKV